MKPSGRASGDRSSAQVLGWWAVLCLATGLASSCSELRRSVGEDCLKNDDCLTGICSQLHCAAAPPYLGTLPASIDAGMDAPAEPDAPSSSEASGDAELDGALAGDQEGTDAASDSAAEAGLDGSADARGDGPAVSAADAPSGG